LSINCPGIFITGTDTGVGKTRVAVGLVTLLAGLGRRVVGLKPVASGAVATPAGLRNDDALALAAASPLALPYERVNPFCFAPAIAPHLAAAEAGVALDVDSLCGWYRSASAGAELAIVEGAGGWRVPLHPRGFLSDLPERLGLGVILVVGLRLGCLNHARLTFEAIERGGRCRFLGWVGNAVDPDIERAADNVRSLRDLLGSPPLALLPWLASPTGSAVATCLDGPDLRRAVEPAGLAPA
jgi:dethiobiotin synthetase